MKYGSVYGKKYAVKTDYGKWDKDFTMEKLDDFIKLFYKKLRKGGTCIIFFDLWKISHLKDMMEKAKFKQIRMIEWIKTNPQPLNKRVNYLTNCREIALLGVKGGKPTFNALENGTDAEKRQGHRGIYHFPIQTSGRIHSTQKSLPLFELLIRNHSNSGDLVVDPFLGGGTTLFASINTGRRFIGTELEKDYYDKVSSKVLSIPGVSIHTH